MKKGPVYSEKEMFARIAVGDELAFKIWYDQSIPFLVPFLRKLTGADAPADDILQETFVRCWMSRDRLPDIQYPRAWLYEVTSHVAYSWLKKKLRYEQIVNGVPLTQESASYSPVEEQVHLHEARRLIQQAIDRLPEQRKKIYLLSRQQGYTIPAIAAQLHITPSTVKNTLVKALSEIREHLAGKGYQMPLYLLLLLIREGK